MYEDYPFIRPDGRVEGKCKIDLKANGWHEIKPGCGVYSGEWFSGRDFQYVLMNASRNFRKLQQICLCF